MRKIIIYIMCFCMLFTVLTSTACKQAENTVVDGEPAMFEETNYTLVKNGSSDYKIVVPTEASVSENVAAKDLQLFINESTGVTLPIVLDNDVTSAESGAYLSVGKTTLFNNSKIVLNAEMNQGSPRIKTIDDDVFMCGVGEAGTLNSVYKFMEYEIGFKAYAIDCVTVKHYPEVKLLDFDYDYIPKIDTWTTEATEFIGNSTEKLTSIARMYATGWHGSSSITLEGKEYSNFWHTLQNFVPDSLYASLHPEWFSNGQLCFTNEEAIKECATNMISKYLLPNDCPYIMLGAWDNHGYCKCENCERDYKLYGGTGGVFVRFANRLAQIIEDEFERMGVNKEVCLVILAYAGYEGAPAIENKDGTFSPAHESVVCDSDGLVTVGVDLSPLHICQSHSINDKNCDTNQYYMKTLQGWSAVTDYLTMYTYTCNFTAPTFYHMDYYALADLMKFYEETGVCWIYEAGTFRQPLDSMRFYIRRQMSWDYTQNIDDLVNEFIEAYYGVGARYVRQYFDALNQRSEAIYTTLGTTCIKTFTDTAASIHWPLQTLRDFASMLESGICEVEKSSLPNSEKSVYIDRIYRELVFVKMDEYKLYANNVDDATYAELVDILEYGKEHYNITYK